MLVALLMLTGACQTREEVSSNPPDLSEIPDHESWNATLTTTQEGVVTSKIHYGHMQRFSGKRIVKFLEGVQIALYNSEGEHVADVRADKAVLNEVSQRIELTDSVVVRAASGMTLSTEKLVWDQRSDHLSSDVYVRVVTAEEDTIHGVGFDSDRNLDNWTIRKPWGVTRVAPNATTQP